MPLPSETVAGIRVFGGAMYALYAGITQRTSSFTRPCLLSGVLCPGLFFLSLYVCNHGLQSAQIPVLGRLGVGRFNMKPAGEFHCQNA